MILVNLKHNKNRWGGVAKNAESSSVKIWKNRNSYIWRAFETILVSIYVFNL